MSVWRALANLPSRAGAVMLVAALGCGLLSACSSPSSGQINSDASDAAGNSENDGENEGGQAGEAGRDESAVLDVSGETPVTRPMVEIPDRWDSEIDELYGRYWLYWEAFAAAYGPPNVDPTYEPLRSLSTDANWDSLQEQLDRFVDGGLILVLPEGSITEHKIRIPNPAILDGEEESEVVLQDCWIDDFVQQTVDGRVVERTREAKLMNVTMKVVDGEWRVDGVTEATPESDGYEQCEQLL